MANQQAVARAENGVAPFMIPFLELVTILHGNRTAYVAEAGLSQSMGEPEPEFWMDRCQKLFLSHKAACDHIELIQNEQTFRALMWLEEAALEKPCNTQQDELPNRFVFDSWLVYGRGGIVVIGG